MTSTTATKMKKKNHHHHSSVKDDAEDVSKIVRYDIDETQFAFVPRDTLNVRGASSSYLYYFLFLLGFILPIIYNCVYAHFIHGVGDEIYTVSAQASYSSSDPRRDFILHPVASSSSSSSSSVDPYLIHMTRSVSDPQASDSSMTSSNAKSRINSSGTSYGVTYPSYKYYYYDVYTQSFRLYPQPWDTEEENSAISSTSSSSSSSKGLLRDFIISTQASSTTSPSSSMPLKYPPTLCDDGHTFGYSDWKTLRNAIHDRNNEYQKFYSRWSWFENAWSEYEMIHFLHPVPLAKSMDHRNQYPPSFSSSSEMLYSKDSSSSKTLQHPWIEPPNRPIESIHSQSYPSSSWGPLVICPGVHIATPRTSVGKSMSILINTESLELQCNGCIFHGAGTHLTFGPQAKNVWISGITFTGATASSLVFPHHGSEVNFLRCNWFHNRGLGSNGGIMDVISTRYVLFRFYHDGYLHSRFFIPSFYYTYKQPCLVRSFICTDVTRQRSQRVVSLPRL